MVTPLFPAIAMTSLSAGTRIYQLNAGSATAATNLIANVRTPIPIAGVVSNMVVTLTAAPGGSDSYTYTLQKNGSDTTMTFVITGAATTGSDTTHPITVAAGDTLSWKVVGTATAAGSNVYMTALFTGTNAGETFISGGAQNANISTPLYFPMMALTTSGTESTVALKVPTDGVLDKLYVDLNASPGVGKSYTFTVYKNGSPIGITCIIQDSNSNNSDLTHNISIAAGDSISLECTPSGTPTQRIVKFSLRFLPTVDGETFVMGIGGSWTTSGTGRWSNYPGTVQNSPIESTSLIAAPTAMNIKKLYIDHNAAPGAGNSWIITNQINAAAGTLTCTIADPATGCTDLTHSDSYSTGDLIDYVHVPVSGPTSGAQTKHSAVYYIPPADLFSGWYMTFV